MREMDKESHSTNIQDGYLAKARKERAMLTVILNSGRKIVGRIRAFDRFTVLLEDRGNEVMIFKHAIATVTTTRSFGNAIRFDRSEGREGKRGEERGRSSESSAERRGGDTAPDPRKNDGTGEGGKTDGGHDVGGGPESGSVS